MQGLFSAMRAVARGGAKRDDQGEAPEVELFGLLAEFRTALRQEIEASRKANAASAVSLVNGRRIGQLGSAFQYLFEVDNALNLPGDAPGDLIVPGNLSFPRSSGQLLLVVDHAACAAS